MLEHFLVQNIILNDPVMENLLKAYYGYYYSR